LPIVTPPGASAPMMGTFRTGVRALTQRWVHLVLLAIAAGAASCKKYCGSGGPNFPPGSGPVVRGPQVALVTPNSVLIAWLTRAPATGEVDYGTGPELGQTASGTPGSTEHAIALEGLAPATLYHYRVVVDGAVASDGHTFRTEPADPAAPFHFVAFADSGSGSKNQRDIAALVLADDPALVLVAGDVVYNCGATSEIDPHYFVPYAGLMDHIPFYLVLGNHDVKTHNGRALLSAVYLPVNDQDGTERFFSFDYVNVHFAGIDSNTSTAPGSDQAVWLDRDLAASTATWKVVYFHHPLFSSSSHGSSLGRRQNLEPIFDNRHVDLVVTGHDHDYERTFPLNAAQVVDAAEEPNYVDPQGTVYIVTGGGGKGLYGSGKSYFTAFSESVHHFTRVEVNGPSLTLTAIREDGSLMDRMTITKTQGVAPAGPP
jgi:hypothetical protein